MRTWALGDMLQSLKTIRDGDGDIFADPNRIGYIVFVEPMGEPTAFFESSGLATMVDEDEVEFICSADGPGLDPVAVESTRARNEAASLSERIELVRAVTQNLLKMSPYRRMKR